MTLSPFDPSAAVVCITGGGSGIGLGLAEKFLEAGSTVIITGRRDSALKAAQERLPKLHVFQNDAADAAERSKLVAWLVKTHPQINVLVNNAGIMRRLNAGSPTSDWAETQKEIAINLEAPIHLTQLLTPHFLKQPEAAFINLSSGLAFVPPSFAPVYGATKAAIHSFTMASRHAYANTHVRLVEIVPPQVQSNLGGTEKGEPTDEFCKSVFERFTAGELEIGYNKSEEWRQAPRQVHEQVSAGMAKMIKPPQL